MAHKGESATLFGDFLAEYPERVAPLAREYWSQMEAKGTVDTFQEKKRRDENSLQGRLLLKSDTLEHKVGRDLGAEWLCLQTIRQLGLDTFLLAQGWSEEKVRFTLAHLITRTVYTPSELKSMRIIQENSAVADILGLDRDKLKKHNIYAVAPALYALKDKLEENGNGLPEFDLDLVTAFLVKEKISPRGMEARRYAIEQGYLVEENEGKTDIEAEKLTSKTDIAQQARPAFPTLLIKDVYGLMKMNPKVKYSQMENNLGVTERTIARAVDWLKENGYINSEHSEIKGEWQLL